VCLRLNERPAPGTIDGAPCIHTSSRAEQGLEGVFVSESRKFQNRRDLPCNRLIGPD
jgi:hypothetical protein